MTVPLPDVLRQSTLSSYAECGEKFRLEHIHGLGGSSWWATLAGTAIHDITAKLDMRDLQRVSVAVPTFADALDAAYADEFTEHNGDVKPTGPVRTVSQFSGGPNKKDKAWWLEWGPQYVDAYLVWRMAAIEDGWRLLEVELPFEVDMGVGGATSGTMDRAWMEPGGNVVIVDLKTGVRASSPVQLAVYREGLHRTTGLLAGWGYFLKFRWSKTLSRVEAYLSGAVDLALDGNYSTAFIEQRFRQARAGMAAGVFTANTSNNCLNACGVSEFCRAFGGARAMEIPVVDSVSAGVSLRDGVSVTVNGLGEDQLA